MRQKTYYELWFQRKGEHWRDSEGAYTLTEAKKKAREHFKKQSIGIIIDSWQIDNDGDIDDDSRRHYSFDGKTFKKF